MIWTYFEAMAPDRIPKSLLVVGSGGIGIEFASFYRTLSAEVTVVEFLPQILPVEDAEIAAKAKNIEVRVGKFPFAGNSKAIALGEDQGLVKVIFDKKSGQLLGAHMVGAEVTELIQGYVVAMNLETTEEELMHTVFPHPTLSEMMKEAVLDAYGRVLNV